jgi:ribonuclease HII
MSQIQFNQLNLFLENKELVIGCDECGYGSISGPLCIGAVKAPKDWKIDGLNDSKQLTPKKREIMRENILEAAFKGDIQFHISERSNKDIDTLGLAPMLKACYIECFNKLYSEDSLIICDGTLKFDGLGVDSFDKVSIIKADTLLPSVMAASILAKTYRDGKMKENHKIYPFYDWDNNVGYYGANGLHIEGIKKYGYSPLHRLSYKLKALNGLDIPVNK